MDVVAWSLAAAAKALREQNIIFEVQTTSPTKKSEAREGELYVVRQQLKENGVYLLIVAAKMRREVQ